MKYLAATRKRSKNYPTASQIDWPHSAGASVEVEWQQSSERSVSIGEPRATIRAQEGTFKGSMARFGHGLQRSFLLATLQELASVEVGGGGDRLAKPR
jgi:hypothetical protein